MNFLVATENRESKFWTLPEESCRRRREPSSFPYTLSVCIR